MEDAARAYDRAAIIMNKYPKSKLNFSYADYSNEIEELRKLGKEKFIASCQRNEGHNAIKKTSEQFPTENGCGTQQPMKRQL